MVGRGGCEILFESGYEDWRGLVEGNDGVEVVGRDFCISLVVMRKGRLFLFC